MEIVVLEEKDNKLFNRKEMKVLFKHSGSSTPTKSEVVKNFAMQNSVDESQVIVDYIVTQKGSAESLARIKILKEKPKVQPSAEKKAENKEVEKVEAQASQST